jgi:hypothetical protein
MYRGALLLASCLVFVAACSSPSSTVPRDRTAFTSTAAAPSVDRGVLRASLAAHRAQQVARLHEYAEAGAFPHNVTVAPSLHMFRDAAGRYCAVANLVHRDGQDDLVEATVRSQNDLAIADVHDGPMMDWMLASGLTQEELVRIQAPAPFIGTSPVRPGRMPDKIHLRLEDLSLGVTEADMAASIRAHVTQMEAELRAGDERSLDLAVERWVAHHGQGASIAT